MKILCRLFGHRWSRSVGYAPKFFVCKRCGEPGALVP